MMTYPLHIISCSTVLHSQHNQSKLITLVGFYSYGEILPFRLGAKYELHNQTMTITTFSEI